MIGTIRLSEVIQPDIASWSVDFYTINTNLMKHKNCTKPIEFYLIIQGMPSWGFIWWSVWSKYHHIFYACGYSASASLFFAFKIDNWLGCYSPFMLIFNWSTHFKICKISVHLAVGQIFLLFRFARWKANVSVRHRITDGNFSLFPTIFKINESNLVHGIATDLS